VDGFGVCRAYRAADAAHGDVPFIFLSALPEDEDRLKAEKVTYNAYLTKPFDFDDLIAEIKKFA
jgi:DNA-binding response OmpR family regulator